LDRQLEEHRTNLTQQLEGVRQTLALERDRYSHDYSLFAARRNEVYAETYALLERARGAFGAQFSKLIAVRDFKGAAAVDLRHLATTLTRISENERRRLLELLDTSGMLPAAGELATRLYEKDALRRANDDFSAFRNATVLHSLYFTPTVEDILDKARESLALLSVFTDERIDEEEPREYKKPAETMRTVDRIASELRHQMRAEMQAGFKPPTVA
jgi:hypothetical protein